MNAPANLPRQRRSPYASTPEIKRLVKAARALDIDVAGFEAFPDGTIRIFRAGAEPGKPDLFEQMEKQGKI